MSQDVHAQCVAEADGELTLKLLRGTVPRSMAFSLVDVDEAQEQAGEVLFCTTAGVLEHVRAGAAAP